MSSRFQIVEKTETVGAIIDRPAGKRRISPLFRRIRYIYVSGDR